MDSVWLVYSEAAYEGQSIHGVFATEADASAWSESVGLTDREYVNIVEWQIGETDFYYTPESWAKESERRKNRPPEMWAKEIPDWTERLDRADVPLLSHISIGDFTNDGRTMTWGITPVSVSESPDPAE